MVFLDTFKLIMLRGENPSVALDCEREAHPAGGAPRDRAFAHSALELTGFEAARGAAGGLEPTSPPERAN
jgi:hypothetical protein